MCVASIARTQLCTRRLTRARTQRPVVCLRVMCAPHVHAIHARVCVCATPQVVNASMVAMLQNGVCRPEGTGGRKYSDLFAWVNDASTSFYEGAERYKGRACDVWASTADPKTAPLKLCVDPATNNPVVLEMQGKHMTVGYGDVHIHVADVTSHLFSSAACISNLKRCTCRYCHSESRASQPLLASLALPQVEILTIWRCRCDIVISALLVGILC